MKNPVDKIGVDEMGVNRSEEEKMQEMVPLWVGVMY